jgi:tryptophan-rich sensory protein
MISSDIRKGVAAVSALVMTSVAGQVATYPNLEPWYAHLDKPSFNPPNWIFAPVWTTLYVLVAFSLWRILKLAPSRGRRTTLLLFVILLLLNAAWSWMTETQDRTRESTIEREEVRSERSVAREFEQRSRDAGPERGL